MAEPTTAQKVLIPAIGTYLTEADPGDPTSRMMFSPWKLSLEKENPGGFRLSHRGAPKAIVEQELEVIFLLALETTECRCTTRADRKTVVCYSHNREISSSGFLCKKECPYEEKSVPQEEKTYTRPLRKTVFLLFRPVGSDAPFMLARFNSVMNNINTVKDLKTVFGQQLAAGGKENPYPTFHIAIVEADVEKVTKGTVGRFGRKIKYAAPLSKDDAARVADLNKAIETLYAEVHGKQVIRAERARAKLMADRAAAQAAKRGSAAEPGAAPASGPAARAEEPAPAHAPSDPSAAPVIPENPNAIEDGHTILDDDEGVAEGDDETPF